MKSFSAKIQIIGVNPYVLLPVPALKELFRAAGRDKGPIPVKGTMNGHPYIQTLVKYSGKWRLYLNTPMRKATATTVGHRVDVRIEYDPVARIIPMHQKLEAALSRNKKAGAVFDKLSPSRKKEIVRYISFLKTEESVVRNIDKVIRHLSGKERFAGRD